jgi:putative DNA primase/helicase
MAKLHEQLLEHGFNASFTPELSTDFIELREENLGRIGYIYQELPHPRGTIKKFVYTLWKRGGYDTLLEYPDDISPKEKKAVEAELKKQEVTYQNLKDARHQIAAIEAQLKLSKCVEPTELPAYLVSKDLEIKKGYKTSLDIQDSMETMYIPMYGANKEITAYEMIHESGEKDFQTGAKAEGSYGVIEGEGDTLYICEGYATAATVHLATNATVAFVRGCSNYLAAIKNILPVYAKDYLVFAADNDKHLQVNLGFIKAQDAANKYSGTVKIPLFYKYDGKNTTDWDDLRRLEGINKVKEGLILTDDEKIRLTQVESVTALGYKNNMYYFTSSQNQTIEAFSTLPKENLIKLIRYEYWEKRYGELVRGQITIPWDKVASELHGACHAKGIYSEENHRGIGIYKDNGRIVLNLGNRLMVDGVVMPIHSLKSKYNYIVSKALGDISKQQLTDEEMALFSASFDKVTLKDPKQKHYILGWMVSAVISGMLEWRPHIYITGSKGSGKSQITNLVDKILKEGWMTIFTQGIDTTPVGLRQTVGSNAVPVFIDEVEGTDKKASSNAAGYIALARGASSNSSSMTLIGSQSQKATQYKVGFCAWLAGITPQLKLSQDLERFVQIDTIKREGGNREDWKIVQKYWDSLGEEFAKKLVARIIANIPTILHNIRETVNSIAECGSNRYADQHGTLLGASLIFRHTNKATPQELERLKNDSLAVEYIESEKTEKQDEMECLRYILEAPIRLGTESSTVRRELTKTDVPKQDDTVGVVLAEFGVIVHDHNKERGLHIRPTSQLRKHMRDLPQYEANFVKTLSRIKGAKSSMQIRFQADRVRGTWVPWDSIFTKDPNDKLDGIQY